MAHIDTEPKIINIIPAPFPVLAVYRDDGGEEFEKPIYLIAIYDTGDVAFLEPDPDGLFTVPDSTLNFVRYSFTWD